MMLKKIIASVALVATVAVSAAMFAAFEAHVINVTAHIENALAVDTYGIDFGTVFPQEYVERQFEIGLSSSFLAEPRAKDVHYKIVQKDKPWTLNFGDYDDVNTHNRSLLFVDPDQGKGEGYTIGGGKLTITTGDDIEDLYGPGEPASGTDWTAPRMVIPMGGNFTIETKVTANPTGHAGTAGEYQSGGILVYGSDGDVVRLELTRWGTGTAGKSAVYMESQENGVKVGKGFTGNDFFDEVYLKLTRDGNEFAGYYSTDGSSWTQISAQPNPFDDFTNENIGGHPKVGLAVTDNNADQSNNSFSADFDYVTFNGDYLSLCRFLSKLPKEGDGDVGVPSYFDICSGCEDPVPDIAYGYLDKEYGENGDIVDGWTVDLKVPPISGYVGQDWPDSCVDWVVEEDEMDYGCDLWIEVTGFSYYECSDTEDNDSDQLIDDHDPDCHEGCDIGGVYHPEWDEAGLNCHGVW